MARKQTTAKHGTAAAAHSAIHPVETLADFDWENVTAQVALPEAPSAPAPLSISMGHTWQGNLDMPTFSALQSCTTGALQFCQFYPLEQPAVVLMAPCTSGDAGATGLYRSGSSARVSLRVALQKYRLKWPKDQKLVFPVLKVHTKAYGWVLALDVAGRKYEQIERRPAKQGASKS